MNIKNMLVPEGKEYYVWVFFVLFFILMFQFLLYPKIFAIRVNAKLTKGFSEQIMLYEKRAGIKSSAKNAVNKQTRALADKYFISKGSVVDLFSKQFIAKQNNVVIKSITYGESIKNEYTSEHPVYIELKCSMVTLKNFLNELQTLGFPLEISNLEIDSLSQGQLFVKIHLILKEEKG